MKTITFNKARRLCMYCGKNEVPLTKWNRRCDTCKKEHVTSLQSVVSIGKRQPSAVLDVDGKKVFVDKFGNEVEEHNYDLTNDPRGYKAGGLIKEITYI